jgi:energy-coupling factor transporter ATP-binding protein EcfA2
MQQNSVNPQEHSLQLPSYEIFNEQAMSIDNYKIFFAYFAKIPCKHALNFVKGSMVKNYIEKELTDDIIDVIYNKQMDWRAKKLNMEDVIYVLKNEMIIYISKMECSMLFARANEPAADLLSEKFKSFKIRKKRRKSISMIITTRRGLDTVDIHVKKPVINLTTHYNDGMGEMHKKLIQTLNKMHESGLVLFHGKPGTGKSTYIKHLIYQVRKEVIFLPPRIAAGMDSPDFTQFLVQHPNTIFVIEDAEELIVNHQGNRNSGMSMLLNLSDGLLGEGLGIQFIATFNTNVDNIDPALLRRGRLDNLYEFKPLDTSKAKALVEKVSKQDVLVTSPMTLAEIYHSDDDPLQYKKQRNQIGFVNERIAS